VSERPARLLREAERCVRKGDREAAVRALREYLDARPRSPKVLNRLGDVLVRDGRTGEAAQAWREAARFFAADGFNHRALALWKKLLRVEPSSPEVLLEMAELHATLGHVAEASQESGAAAEAFLARGDRERALAAFERSVALDPASPLRLRLARLYGKQGIGGPAFEHYRLGLAALERRGRHGEALTVLREAVKLLPESRDLRIMLARVATSAGEAGEAIALLEPLERSDGPDPPRSLVLAAAYRAAGRRDAAADLLNGLVEGPPGSEEARLALAALRVEEGRVDEALELCEPVVETRLAERRFEEAASALEAIAAQAPSHVPTLLRLAHVHQRADDREALADVYERLAAAHERAGAPALARAARDLIPALDHKPLVSAPLGKRTAASAAPDAARAIAAAAREIKGAAALLVAAGTGFAADFGLTDWADDESLWRACPPYRAEDLTFEELARAGRFDSDPALAWGFFGHRLAVARQREAHAGLRVISRWRGLCPGGAFAATSLVDGQFLKAGFHRDRIVECRGSLHWLQCARECGAPPVLADEVRIDVDTATMRARPPFPRCPACGAIARPNVLLLEDWAWEMSRVTAQDERLKAWLARAAEKRGLRIAVLECGETPRLPSLRLYVRRLVRDADACIIRVSDDDWAVPEGGVGVPLDPSDALPRIDEALRALR